MGGTLACGVRFLGVNSSAPLMILLGDMPNLTTATLAQIFAVSVRNSGKIIQPYYRGTPGHPLIWPADLRPRLSCLTGDSGGKRIIAEIPERLRRLEWADDSVLQDIDFPRDYLRLKPT